MTRGSCRRFYGQFKSALPSWLRECLSGVNQRLFARATLRRKYGGWFEVDWRRKYRSLTDDQWRSAYDTFWSHASNECVEQDDANLIVVALGKRGTVLELGCGSGALAVRLAREGFQVTGMDVSTRALELAAQRAVGDGVAITLLQGFAERIPAPDRSFDHVTCCHTLEHVRDLAATVSEIKRVARDKIVVIVPQQPFRLYAENYHTQFFQRPEQLESAFALDEQHCREIDCRGHRGEFQGWALFYVGSVRPRRERTA